MRLKAEVTGLEVHHKIKHMVKSYGAMMTGVAAETLGQNQAEISLESVKKTGNIRENISHVVQESDMVKPTNSCGQASNEVCELLLGIEEARHFEKVNYQVLSEDGANMKKALSNGNLLIRVEVDRDNAPKIYRKITREEFNPGKVERNKIYLLEDQLLYLNEFGKVIDLEQTPEKCKALFDAIQTPQYCHYMLGDPLIEKEDGPEEEAMCEIDEIVKAKAQHLDSWLSTHSFTIFSPQAENENLRSLYPYQAYWTQHSLQAWFSGNKDEKLSQLGMDKYIEKLALLGTTLDSKERSATYAELFSTPGREAYSSAGLNEKLSALRVKFRITEVNPELALENLEAVQDFIDSSYPGEDVESQCELYKTAAQEAMTVRLEARLLPPLKQEPSEPSIGRSRLGMFNVTIERVIASSITKEDHRKLAIKADSFSEKEGEKLVEFFKTLPPEELKDIQNESRTVKKAWEEQCMDSKYLDQKN